MSRKVAWLVTAVLIAFSEVGETQQTTKSPRIGFLATASQAEMIPFRDRLRELDYIEGHNITIEIRFWRGKIERVSEILAEFVRLRCDVIVTTGTESAQAAKKATQAIPIVMAFSGDAVRLGVVPDLARPAGNITGLTSINAELSGKRVEILKEVVPGLSRLALFWSQGNPNTEYVLKETAAAARSFRVGTQPIELKTPDEFNRAFTMAITNGAQGFMLGGGGFLSAHQKALVEHATKSRLPGLYPNRRYVEAGGLMTYTEDRVYMLRRAAEYVDKILKGIKPADLPVERPAKFELVINLNAAKQIGLTIPPNVLARADRVIK
jgi:putative ABC transport system substrate-binding protein